MSEQQYRTCTFSYEIEDKAGSNEQGVFRGYANVTDFVDSGGDNVRRGAFARTIKKNKGKFPLFGFHDPTVILGYVEVNEDERGLKVNKGVLNLATDTGREWYEGMKLFAGAGMKMEMSIGYIPDPKKIDYIDGVRHIKELKLKEVSLLPPGYAMNSRSRVSGVKSLRELLRQALEEPPPDEQEKTEDDNPAPAGFFDAQISELESKLDDIEAKLTALLDRDSADEGAPDSPARPSGENNKSLDCDPQEHSQAVTDDADYSDILHQINQLTKRLQERT